MKKTVERLLFMLLGAILVLTAYLVGSTDNTVDAKFTTFEDVIITGSLVVEGAILVGDTSTDHGNLVHIQADKRAATVMLFHNRDNAGNSDATVLMSASKAKDKIHAGIRLKDKHGNASIGTAALGWSKEK